MTKSNEQIFLESKGYSFEFHGETAQLLREYAAKNNELMNAKLEHHKDTTIGLWATDQVDAIPEDKKDLFFQIEFK